MHMPNMPNTKKRTAQHKACGVQLSGAACAAPFMGEEKPDEELMGKRKSSPRLSTALSCRYSYNVRHIPILYRGTNIFSCQAKI